MKFNIAKFKKLQAGSYYYRLMNPQIFEIVKRAGFDEHFTSDNGVYEFQGEYIYFLPENKKRKTFVYPVLYVDNDGDMIFSINGKRGSLRYLSIELIEKVMECHKNSLESLIKDEMIIM